MTTLLSDEAVISPVNLPATPKQRRLVLVVALLLFVAFGITLPFADRPLPQFNSFIPSFEAVIFINALITALLLFAQYSIAPARAILALACGYFFTALIVIPHALTFPGAFTATGLLGAGLQSTAWLFFFWHFGTSAAILCYAFLKANDADRAANQRKGTTRSTIAWSMAIVVALVFGLTLIATAENRFLPVIFTDTTHLFRLHSLIVSISVMSVAVLALIVLWLRRHSVLDYWLMLVVCALLQEQTLTAIFSSERFSLGFYAGRVFSLLTSVFVLILLLQEFVRLHAGLARSNGMLQRERDNKLMNLEAMAASIAHEVRQPLAAINMNGRAALRFLGHEQPDLNEVRSSLNRIVSDSHRTSEVFDNLRALFGKTEQSRNPVDVNKVITAALGALGRDLRDHEITTRLELTPQLPLVAGHEGQLQEVVLNLVRNAIEAMNAMQNGPRTLRARTTHQGDKIVVAIEDTGPGIDPEKLDHIFDAFVTTKRRGMGLGLAICRMIIERHAGKLSATLAHPHGVIFQIFLPQMAVPAG